MYMLRDPNGGHAIYFTVQRLCASSSPDPAAPPTWSGVANQFIAKVPSNLRWDGDGRMLEPFRSFGACGDLWQETGNDGFKTLEPAHELCRLLRQYNPGDTYRVVKVGISVFVKEQPLVVQPWCPVCGSSARVFVTSAAPSSRHAVACDNMACGVQGPRAGSQEEALERWATFAAHYQVGRAGGHG